jgi:hypothetical protein
MAETEEASWYVIAAGDEIVIVAADDFDAADVQLALTDDGGWMCPTTTIVVVV